jgi:hypothetical protein
MYRVFDYIKEEEIDEVRSRTELKRCLDKTPDGTICLVDEVDAITGAIIKSELVTTVHSDLYRLRKTRITIF